MNEAVVLLSDYNSRLSLELSDRKKVAKMLHDYIVAQKQASVVSEQRLEVRLVSYLKRHPARVRSASEQLCCVISAVQVEVEAS